MTEGTQTTGRGVLETLVAAMRYLGTPSFHQMGNDIPVIVALCPEHADEIARGPGSVAGRSAPSSTPKCGCP